MMRKVICISFSLAISIISQSSIAQRIFYIGGGLSYQIPNNTFGSDNFGFGDVAAGGFGINASSIWMYSERLSIGSEIGYSIFPKDKSFWNVDRYGEINVNYQMINALLQGNVYLGEDDIMPYIGALFGAYYLSNYMNFSSNYVGTDNDASASYRSNSWHAGFGLEVGTLIKASKKNRLQLSLRYTFVPNIKAEYIPEDDITLNPHGKQNHWSITFKMLFGLKRK